MELCNTMRHLIRVRLIIQPPASCKDPYSLSFNPLVTINIISTCLSHKLSRFLCQNRLNLQPVSPFSPLLFFNSSFSFLAAYYNTCSKTTYCIYYLLHHLKMIWQYMRSIKLDQCICPNHLSALDGSRPSGLIRQLVGDVALMGAYFWCRRQIVNRVLAPLLGPFWQKVTETVWMQVTEPNAYRFARTQQLSSTMTVPSNVSWKKAKKTSAASI